MEGHDERNASNPGEPSELSRRGLLRTGAVLAGAAAGSQLIPGPSATAAPTSAAARPTSSRHRTALRLLGTAGGPPPWPDRLGISSALVVAGRTYLVDLGHGSYDQILKAGLTADSVQGIYITHLHSDHIADLYTFLWLRFGGLNAFRHPIEVYGPGRAGGLPQPTPTSRIVSTVHPEEPTPGLTDFLTASIAATAYDINIRIRDEGWPDIRNSIRPNDIRLPDVDATATGDIAPAMQPFLVMEDDYVRVTAILARHPPVFPSFAFRFDTDDGSVVFSGDTTLTPNIPTLTRGADILVHEAIDLDWFAGQGLPTPLLHHLAGAHTDINKVGAVAEQAGVPTLVLNHLAPAGTNDVSNQTWRHKASQGFSGRIIVGTDLDEIGIGPGHHARYRRAH